MTFNETDYLLLKTIGECAALLCKQMKVDGFMHISVRKDGYVGIDVENVNVCRADDKSDYSFIFKKYSNKNENEGYQE